MTIISVRQDIAQIMKYSNVPIVCILRRKLEYADNECR